jgi:hypothetical protein
VRQHPEDAYDPTFMDRVHAQGALTFTTGE